MNAWTKPPVVLIRLGEPTRECQVAAPQYMSVLRGRGHLRHRGLNGPVVARQPDFCPRKCTRPRAIPAGGATPSFDLKGVTRMIPRVLLDLAAHAFAPPAQEPNIRAALNSLREVTCGVSKAMSTNSGSSRQLMRGRSLRRHVRSRMSLQVATDTATLHVLLRNDAVLPGIVTHLDPDGTAHLRMLGGHALGSLPVQERVPARHPAGRLKIDDTVWVSVMEITPASGGDPIQLLTTQRDRHIPSGAFGYRFPDLAARVCLQTLSRVPGVETVIAVSPVGTWDGDPVREVVGDQGARVRQIGTALGGERIRVVRVSAS